jgi:hypothetical protein
MKANIQMIPQFVFNSLTVITKASSNVTSTEIDIVDTSKRRCQKDTAGKTQGAD